MKTFIILISLLCFFSAGAQTVNGKILPTNNNITIVKVWGTHQERGYAQGYLLAAKIQSIYRDYIMPKFGVMLGYAKTVLLDSSNFKIDSAYVSEAKAVASGMIAAGVTGYDYTDLLVANSLLDLSSIISLEYNIDFNMGCSSLMSWGDATAGTALNGKSVVTRNLDWEVSQYLNNNQVMVIHIPSELNEQPWVMIGFAGQISVLSGTNSSGVSAFQHVLSGLTGHAALGKGYTPIWFAIRKALESKDFNSDGMNNTNDVRSSLLESQNGYAANCIVSVSASAANLSDSLIALVAEVANTAPFHSFRSNSYDDKIPGDNLYAANSPICRNDARAYCVRYNSLTTAITTGTSIDTLLNWTLLRDYSRVVSGNIQLMQIIPELKLLKLSVYTGTPAYNATPYYYNLDTLFNTATGIHSPDPQIASEFLLLNNYPNPFNPSTKINYQIPTINDQTALTEVSLKVYDILGRDIATLVNESKSAGSHTVEFNASGLPGGIYFYELRVGEFREVKKMSLLR